MTLLKLAMLIQQEIHGIERLGPIWRPLWWVFYSRMISWYYCALELPDMMLKDGLASNGQEPHLRFPFFSYYLVDKWGKWIIRSMLIIIYVVEWVSCGVQQKINGDLTWQASLKGETCQSTLKLTSVVTFGKLHFRLPCSSPGCGGQYQILDLSRYLSGDGDAKQPFLSGLQRHKSLWWYRLILCTRTAMHGIGRPSSLAFDA